MMNQQNPLQLLQMVRSGQVNPQQLAMQLIEQNMGNTPMGANLMNMAKNNQTKDIEQVARNVAQQRGYDFDKEFANFRKLLGL